MTLRRGWVTVLAEGEEERVQGIVEDDDEGIARARLWDKGVWETWQRDHRQWDPNQFIEDHRTQIASPGRNGVQKCGGENPPEVAHRAQRGRTDKNSLACHLYPS